MDRGDGRLGAAVTSCCHSAFLEEVGDAGMLRFQSIFLEKWTRSADKWTLLFIILLDISINLNNILRRNHFWSDGAFEPNFHRRVRLI